MPSPQNASGLTPYAPNAIGSSPINLPVGHQLVRQWSLQVPDAAGTYDVVVPANLDIEIIQLRFRRSSTGGNAADTYRLDRGTGGDEIGTVTAAAAADSISSAPSLDTDFRSVTGGTTLRLTVTDAGGNSDGVFDIVWVQS